MDCALITEQLIAYHFATCDEPERTLVEQHLLACNDCLRAYLRLKRDIERGASGGDRPSDATRQRLRARVAAAFPPPASNAGAPAAPPVTATTVARPRLWSRRIPLYQGLAAALLAAGLALLVPALLHGRPDPSGGDAVIDTRRPVPESIHIL
jgi:anti-sigma factor RsiW